jgi:hypothetical protein
MRSEYNVQAHSLLLVNHSHVTDILHDSTAHKNDCVTLSYVLAQGRSSQLDPDAPTASKDAQMAPQKKNRSLFASFLKSEWCPRVAVAAGWRRLGEGQGGCTSDQQQDLPRLATHF